MKISQGSAYAAPSFAAGSQAARWVQAQQQAAVDGIAQGETSRVVPTTDSLVAIYTRGSFEVEAAQRAERALVTMQDELKKFDQQLKTDGSRIADHPWDVTVVNGKLAVVGGHLSSADKDWLETRLNQNDKMVSAAKTYVEAAVVYLQNDEDNPPFVQLGGVGGARIEHNFSDVAQQLSGALGFKANIQAVVDLLNVGRSAPEKQTTAAGLYAGHYSFDLLAAKLAVGAKAAA